MWSGVEWSGVEWSRVVWHGEVRCGMSLQLSVYTFSSPSYLLFPMQGKGDYGSETESFERTQEIPKVRILIYLVRQSVYLRVPF